MHFSLYVLWLIFLVLCIIVLTTQNSKACGHTVKNTTTLDEVGAQVNHLLPDKIQQGGSGDKGSHHHDYLEYYEILFLRFQDKPWNLLEIGIQRGYSLVTWLRKYPQVTITGVDINTGPWKQNLPKFALKPQETRRLQVLEADATLPSILETLPETYDVILDDGSHLTKDMISSFELLFPTRLKRGGLYIVEDVHCDGEMVSFLQYAKNLIPHVFKSSSMEECKTLSGRSSIAKRSTLDWRFSISEIIIHRDIVVFTKESW
jgi:hypothetical protein